MRARRRGRTIGAVAISAALHAVILAALALYVPRLVIPEGESGPPQPIIPVLLVPRTPPAHAGGKPEPVRLHRRPQPFAAPPAEPLTVRPNRATKPPKPGPVTLHPAPLPEGPKADIRETLRISPVGCANPDAVQLTKAERAACDEQLGKGAPTAPFLGLGLDRAKQIALDHAAARQEADRRYRDAPALPATDPMHGSPEPWSQPSDPHQKPDLPLLPP
ncbi:MAG: hypothetical protein KGO51_00430 [Alphaproteobacteria bacterium]|nr:hypothetical protein [Alphaproteobacteria bacterium]